MRKVKVTLTEAINLLQELDYVPGVSMAVPDFNYTVNKRRNFDAVDSGDEFPYDSGEGGGPQNSQGYGQQGVGRGGVGMGGRPDSSGGVRAPSAAYTSTWDTTDEGADYDEVQRHGRPRNIWRDTPEGEVMKKKVDDDERIGESMGTPFQTGPVAPMDGPSLQSFGRGYSSGSELDQLPSNQDMNNGPGNMWGGPGTIPGTSRSWAGSPTLGDHPNDVWKIPEQEEAMKLREFFDPAPIEAEPLTNPEQNYLNDATDEEIEDGLQGFGGPGDEEEEHHAGEVQGPEGDEEPQSFTGRYGGETILMLPNMGRGSEFIMSPDKFGAARGTYGMHMDNKNKVSPEMLDKRSAWDVLQHVISAMANQKPQEPEKPENVENTDQPG